MTSTAPSSTTTPIALSLSPRADGAWDLWIQGDGETPAAAQGAEGGEPALQTPREGDEGTTKKPQSPFSNIWMLLLIGAVIWFLIFAPERKARKQRETMLAALKKGDRVVTTGGLMGQVVEVRETEVTLKCNETRLTFARSSVHQIVDGKGEPKGESKADAKG